MDRLAAFVPRGETSKVAANTTAPAGLQCTGDTKAEPLRMLQYRLMNNATETIFYAYGIDGTTATANAVIPTGFTTNAKKSYPLPAGGIEVISAPSGSFWSGITVTGAAALFVTPGLGI